MMRRTTMIWALAVILSSAMILGGCSEEDCPTCVEPAPVAPTAVYSVSGDDNITVYWNDYAEIYNDDLVGYRIWSRYFEEGDQNNPAREFYLMDEVLVGDNYDPSSGQYHWVDTEIEHVQQYEYAVSSFTESAESYLSFEFVVDAPLPMSETPVVIHDVLGPNSNLAGFDFSRAADTGAFGENGDAGVIDPTQPGNLADVQVRFDENGVPWMETMWDGVRVQDFGTFLDENDNLDFAGVSWAPAYGWSESGVLELIPGHIYVVEIYDEHGTSDLHYAKLGVVSINESPSGSYVRVHWAYQPYEGLPELSVPEPKPSLDPEPQMIRL